MTPTPLAFSQRSFSFTTLFYILDVEKWIWSFFLFHCPREILFYNECYAELQTFSDMDNFIQFLNAYMLVKLGVLHLCEEKFPIMAKRITQLWGMAANLNTYRAGNVSEKSEVGLCVAPWWVQHLSGAGNCCSELTQGFCSWVWPVLLSLLSFHKEHEV